jgi:hypothetical protein
MESADRNFKVLRGLRNKAQETLEILYALHPFVKAIESEIGQQLLSDDVKRHHDLLMKTYSDTLEKGTPDIADVAEMRYLRRRIETVSFRLQKYGEAKDEAQKDREDQVKKTEGETR